MTSLSYLEHAFSLCCEVILCRCDITPAKFGSAHCWKRLKTIWLWRPVTQALKASPPAQMALGHDVRQPTWVIAHTPHKEHRDLWGSIGNNRFGATSIAILSNPYQAHISKPLKSRSLSLTGRKPHKEKCTLY